jgi:hypothetical protein
LSPKPKRDRGVKATYSVKQSLLLLAAVAGIIACQRDTRELFVLPDSYEGPFIAIYDQPGGVSPQWASSTAVYRVPSSGVVRISTSEPPKATRTAFAFASGKRMRLSSYSTCADMREAVADSSSGVCWLDFQGGGTGIPDHMAAVVSTWERIPFNFERTTSVYDSVLFGAKGHFSRKWEEPVI